MLDVVDNFEEAFEMFAVHHDVAHTELRDDTLCFSPLRDHLVN